MTSGLQGRSSPSFASHSAASCNLTGRGEYYARMFGEMPFTIYIGVENSIFQTQQDLNVIVDVEMAVYILREWCTNPEMPRSDYREVRRWQRAAPQHQEPLSPAEVAELKAIVQRHAPVVLDRIHLHNDSATSLRHDGPCAAQQPCFARLAARQGDESSACQASQQFMRAVQLVDS